MKPLSDVLESEIPEFYYASRENKNSRVEKRTGKRQYNEPTIWHENKGGNISAYPYSCALRAGASYNYLLVDGEIRLTERGNVALGHPYSLIKLHAITRPHVNRLEIQWRFLVLRLLYVLCWMQSRGKWVICLAFSRLITMDN